MSKQPAERIGERFGKWTIIGEGHVVTNQRYWLCRCVCGTRRHIPAANLYSGASTQCRRCADHARRVNPNRCAGCGTNISRSAVRCLSCDGDRRSAASIDKPRRYPVSIGTIARQHGISRQAVQCRIKRWGFDKAMELYAKEVAA